MKLSIAKLALLLFLFSSCCFASPDVIYLWNNVSFETDQGKVFLEVNRETGKLETMKLTINGKEILVGKKHFEGLSSIQLHTVKFTGGCSLNPVKCYHFISFNYLEDVDFDVYPDWYEDPKVTYTFSEGEYQDRRQRIQKSEKYWELITTNKDGTVKIGKEEVVGSY
ncbi:hypothetical protein [Aliikangiella coralliicola]|uniref:Lipoprotein n=1 Tax=Aliikangiella coralliicola TaxID=2592383 RepID=A0A545UFV0_9GAMM|nr:hypothetical protein [Aliikangiella coralliicola]TQV88263.1 hypothetical protein FLL46_06975 [Aliikangiella coralliicola]